jgi:hypothetical protein
MVITIPRRAVWKQLQAIFQVYHRRLVISQRDFEGIKKDATNESRSSAVWTTCFDTLPQSTKRSAMLI